MPIYYESQMVVVRHLDHVNSCRLQFFAFQLFLSQINIGYHFALFLFIFFYHEIKKNGTWHSSSGSLSCTTARHVLKMQTRKHFVTDVVQTCLVWWKSISKLNISHSARPTGSCANSSQRERRVDRVLHFLFAHCWMHPNTDTSIAIHSYDMYGGTENNGQWNGLKKQVDEPNRTTFK